MGNSAMKSNSQSLRIPKSAALDIGKYGEDLYSSVVLRRTEIQRIRKIQKTQNGRSICAEQSHTFQVPMFTQWYIFYEDKTTFLLKTTRNLIQKQISESLLYPYVCNFASVRVCGCVYFGEWSWSYLGVVVALTHHVCGKFSH